jgi:hypothetical protein
MRATISFEIDLDQVEGTMGMLAAQEAHNLRDAANILEDYHGPGDKLLEEVTQALQLLEESTVQLQQYRDMLLSFERAKFETILPQPADAPLLPNMAAVKSTLDGMQQFEGFLNKINEEGDTDDPAEG